MNDRRAAIVASRLSARWIGELARRALPFLLIAVLAFGYRLVIMSNRAAAPNETSHWDPLPAGHDQATYIEQLRDLQTGDFPPKSFYFQPGIVYILGAVAALAGTTDLLALRLVLAGLASLNCALLAFVAWRWTGRRRAGFFAGLLLALYPVGACYDTDFVITSQAVVIATGLLACSWLARARPGAWLAPLGLGLLAGLGAVTRFELIAPGLVCACWLLRAGGWRHFALALLGIAIVLTPVALHNRAGGASHLISSEGPRLLYMGNNRDSAGVYGPSNASATTRLDYIEHLLRDIAMEPARFVQLSLRKAALFFTNIEPGNNLDYRQSCEDLSLALLANPLDFPMLAALAFWGLLALHVGGKREEAWFLLAAGASYGLLVLATMVEARLKTPVIVWMLPAAGYALDVMLRVLGRRVSHSQARRSVMLLLATFAVLRACQWGATELPRDLTVSELPRSATRAGLLYDNNLEFVGWKAREEYSPSGVIQPYHPWVVSLYWRLLQPTDIDYSFSLKYRIGDETWLEYDRPLGYTVYPRDFTSQWRAGSIYVEHIGLAWQSYDAPYERTGRVTLEVYPERRLHERFTPVDSRGDESDHPILAAPAILLPPGYNALPQTMEASFGDQLILLGYDLPATGAPGATLSVKTAWRTGSQPIAVSYVIGLYLFHEGEFIANQDSPPRRGELLTSSLLPDFHFDDEKSLVLPPGARVYDVYIGVYDSQSMARLELAGSADNLLFIGPVDVE